MLQPDGEWAVAVNNTLRQRLFVAFDHIVTDVLREPSWKTWPSNPCAFALQDRFRVAATAGDVNLLRTLHAAHEDVLAKPDEDVQGLRIISWDDASLSSSESALLQAAFQDDIGLTAHLLAPGDQKTVALQRTIPRILDRLGDVLPTWEQEFRAMVRWIVLAESSEGGFAGASAFAAWGAILVNPEAQEDDLALLLTLIHESSHMKLFCAYLDDEIVLNDLAETYSSPLRLEPRPMNGIYHAAYVLARMACFAHDLRQSGRATEVIGTAADGLNLALQASVVGFGSALEVIRSHGKLTELGLSIIDEAAAGVKAIPT
ncbi:HEXXH motif-containing putative peptide modification protein [Cypionkella sp.]|uniref:aKG-HExxH-type peptide beta-hydroxylase n=1 Tax=Cypionkella sp. TaxID=2811411 RepID=UPI00260A83D1|nr:HEXXH motif-containing putative peptide modification protein [Cypionkella sp.]MDB5663802.1 hypothetical protein [Cypionkella sp.]